jgi:hypothetical protein
MTLERGLDPLNTELELEIGNNACIYLSARELQPL